MSNAQAVNNIYQHLFNRDADVGGLTYYVDGLLKGNFTLASIMLNVLNGAQGGDVTIINNKLTAAQAFTDTIDTTPEILSYAGNGAAQGARTWLATVDGTAASVTAATAAIDSTLGGFTGAEGQTFTLTTGVDTLTGTAGNGLVSITMTGGGNIIIYSGNNPTLDLYVSGCRISNTFWTEWRSGAVNAYVNNAWQSGTRLVVRVRTPD